MYVAGTGLSNTPCSNGIVRVVTTAYQWKMILVNDVSYPDNTYINIKTGSWSGWYKYTGTSV